MKALDSGTFLVLCVLGILVGCAIGVWQWEDRPTLSAEIERLRYQRDRLAWAARDVLACGRNDPMAWKFDRDLNRCLNAIEYEDGDDTLFDFKNRPAPIVWVEYQSGCYADPNARRRP